MSSRPNTNQSRGRIRFIAFLLLICALLIIYRLYDLQIIHGQDYVIKADRQHLNPGKIPFNRGTIYFSGKDKGLVAGATISRGYTLAINPSKIQDDMKTYEALAPYIPDVEDYVFLAKASKKNDPYEEIEHRLSEEDKDKISEMNLKGVSLFQEAWRTYPGNNLGSHVIGFISHEGKGLYGIEKYYDEVLFRKPASANNFFVSIFSNVQALFSGGNSEGDIVTTIEPTVQSFLEQKMQEVSNNWNPKIAGAIVMDPRNGEILAMVSKPSFNPNNIREQDLPYLSNPLVESVFEFGSIVKALTMAIGLDTGAVTAETTYEDKGSVTLNGATFYNFDKKANGVVNMQTVLNKSLNTGVSFVVKKTGNDKYASYMKKLIGDETGIDLPNEAKAMIDGLDSPRDIEYATASFGQGIAFTPVAMIRALATLGNGGFLIDPHVLKEKKFSSGISKPYTQTSNSKRVFSNETSEEISRMLTKVVDEALLNGQVKMKNYSVAAKTGTAQIYSEEGGYSPDRFLHSFFGYFPSFEPRYLILLFQVEPKGAEYASQTLTLPFMDIVEFLIQYYNVPPDRGENVTLNND